MYARVEKAKENKSKAIANSVAQNKSNGKQGFGFVDNRQGGRLRNNINTIQQGVNSKTIQKTVLHDVSVEKIQEADNQYVNKKDYADEYEIFQSAKRLASQYNTKPYPIKIPFPKKLNKEEPVILVGHGGDGQFMNIDSGLLKSYLVQWGVEKNMQVILAGCNTDKATEVIEVAKEITGVSPKVNNALAYTGEDSEYSVPDDDESYKLLKGRTKELKKLEVNFVISLRTSLLEAVNDTITENNYNGVLKYLQNDGERYKHTSKVKDEKYNKRGKVQVQNELSSLIKLMLSNNIGKDFKLDEKMPKILNDIDSLSFKLGEKKESVTMFLKKTVPELIKNSNIEARNVTDGFVNQIISHPKAEKISYI